MASMSECMPLQTVGRCFTITRVIFLPLSWPSLALITALFMSTLVHMGKHMIVEYSTPLNSADVCQLGNLIFHPPRRLPNDGDDGRPVPHFFLGDDAFKMTTSIVKGYPHPPADKSKAVFNYRVSRARRVVENSFGILSQRWRIYLRSMQLLPERADWVVKATVVLHNYLTSIQDKITQDVHLQRVELEEARGMGRLSRSMATNSTSGSKELQEYLKDYMNDESRGGSVLAKQISKCVNHIEIYSCYTCQHQINHSFTHSEE